MVVRINGITYFGIILFSTKRHLSFFAANYTLLHQAEFIY